MITMKIAAFRILYWLMCPAIGTALAGTVKTNADVDAELARYRSTYQASQLTSRPQRDLDPSHLYDTLFYRLPISERAIYVMESFANVTLDGEYSERMQIKLIHLRDPHYDSQVVPPNTTPADKEYTKLLYKTIDSYSDAQIRAFCGTPEAYARFQQNLKQWKKFCRMWGNL
jgi:hypothetical protein